MFRRNSSTVGTICHHRSAPKDTMNPYQNVPLAPRTTLHVGGPARAFVRAESEDALIVALRAADESNRPVWILGGGSNVLIADEGLPGTVIEIATEGIEIATSRSRAQLTARAGEQWDDVVRNAVERDLAGVECLSGIPGRVGATPIQNVGAYGQEVAQTIRSVDVWDRVEARRRRLSPDECEFAYRDSRFKRDPDRFVVLAVELDLVVGGAASVRYGQLRDALADDPAPSLARVREAVLKLRRSKSMVYDPSDDNHRSAGSFFTNPVVDTTTADDVARRALAAGTIDDPTKMPRYPAPDGVKLAAGWLIEAAGMARGYGDGPVGLSTRHALAIVNRGTASAADIVAFARHVRDRVHDAFGVTLVPEPVFLGLEPL